MTFRHQTNDVRALKGTRGTEQRVVYVDIFYCTDYELKVFWGPYTLYPYSPGSQVQPSARNTAVVDGPC